jgi:hypothetical protein
MCWVKDYYDENKQKICVEYFCQKHNKRIKQPKIIPAPFCPDFITKCSTCSNSNCNRESKIFSLEMHEGIKLIVIECENYEERNCCG